jgi:sugar phosphate isomerase/epimerase
MSSGGGGGLPGVLGAISNAWTVQLKADPDLLSLVTQAAARGARHVELRMGSLGDAERSDPSRTLGTGYAAGDIGAPGDLDWRPVIPKLAEIANAHPQLTFNLAVSFRVYAGLVDPSVVVDPMGEQMTMAIEAAKLLGRPPTPLPADWGAVGAYCGPHLRIVDPTRFGSPGSWGSWESESDISDEVVQHVSALASRTISEEGVRLSIENSGQPFRSMGLLLSRVRRSLPPGDAAELGLCFDPTNPVMSGLEGDPLAELAELPADMLMLAHFKQCVDRTMIPTVDDGDVDFARYMSVLADAPFRGPLVFEIPPHADALENLSASFDYIHALRGTPTSTSSSGGGSGGGRDAARL